MSKSKSAKSVLQERARGQRNRSRRSALRTAVKKVILEAEGNNQEQAKTALAQAVPVIDKMCSKGLIHPNKAARYKSRLTKRVNALAVAAA